MWRLFYNYETNDFHAFNEPIEVVDHLVVRQS
jgi:hypothetical protein